MKEALVLENLSVKIIESLIPTPSPDELIIQVVTIGLNPVDWKTANPVVASGLLGMLKAKPYANPGKDIAGYVHSVGSNVKEFKIGDRVACTNHGGGFAEYAIGPNFTTYFLPDHVSFAEAASYGLGFVTAALNLYQELSLPEPWNPAARSTPLVIYGATSTVGAFAVKLARLSNIHPIIAIAGRGTDFVSSLVDSVKGDIVIDYRKGSEFILHEIQKVAPKIEYILDAISTPETISLLSPVLSPTNGNLSLVLPQDPPASISPGIKVTVSFAPLLWEPNGPPGLEGDEIPNIARKAFGHVIFRFLSHAQANHLITHHPYEVVEGGLEGISQGLKNLRDGKNSGCKYIIRLAD